MRMATLFRERAVASRSATEVTDRPVRVVNAPVWTALALALVLLALLAVWLIAGTVALTTRGQGVINNLPANVAVRAPAPGLLSDSLPAVGTQVAAGERLAVLSAPAPATGQPTGTEVIAPISGTVVAAGPGQGSSVDAGTVLTSIAPDSDTQLGYLFIPTAPSNDVSIGARVVFNVEGVNATDDGLLEGTVSSVSPLPAERARIAYLTASEELTTQIMAAGPVVEVQVALVRDPGTPTGLRWTLPPGPAAPITSGTPAQGTLILSEVRPYQAFLGSQ